MYNHRTITYTLYRRLYMNISATVKSERIDLRTNTEVKTIIERAAQLRHTTISAYLLDSALQKAKEDIQNTETLILTEADRDSFFRHWTIHQSQMKHCEPF